jgi:hypothetical protein
MAKIVLGKRPESFKHTVKFPLLDGTEGSIEITYKYRTRTEFGEFLDQWMEEGRLRVEAQQKAEQEARAEGDKPADADATRALQVKIAESNADYILRIAEGWNLDVPFSRDSVKQLSDELPAAANGIMNNYRAAIIEGRLGN